MAELSKIDKMSDEELVRLTIEDQENFLYLINRYKDKLIRYIRRISSMRYEDAEDVLQEVFIKAYQNINSFDTDLKFSSWIYRITHNEVIDNYRRLKARPQEATWDTEDFLNNIASDSDFSQDVDLSFLRANIDKILLEMDIKYKEVLILKFLEEKDYKEISDILKKPMGTVATLINRAKKQFVKKMKEQDIKL